MHKMLDCLQEKELLEKARAGDLEAFEVLYRPLASYKNSLCRRFFLPGAEKEDVGQEAMFGFAQAIQEFDTERGGSFHDYAMLRMRNAVVASVRKATRKKQLVLSEASSLEVCGPVMTSRLPDAIAADRCYLKELFQALKGSLSGLELGALIRRAEGVTVREIAAALSLGEKAVENALFRARRKAKKATLALDY